MKAIAYIYLGLYFKEAGLEITKELYEKVFNLTETDYDPDIVNKLVVMKNHFHKDYTSMLTTQIEPEEEESEEKEPEEEDEDPKGLMSLFY